MEDENFIQETLLDSKLKKCQILLYTTRKKWCYKNV